MGGVQGAFSCAGAAGNFRISVFRLPPVACWRRQAITLDKCCDWLQHCLMNIPT